MPYLLALFLTSLCVPAAAQESYPAAYGQAVEAAVGEFSRGQWLEARALFRKAHQIQPSARTLRGLGMVAFELREYAPALEYLSASVADGRRPLSADQRKQASALIKRSRAFVGRVEVKVEPGDALLLIDRVLTPIPSEPLTLSIGKHVFSLSAKGHERVEQAVVIEGGDSRTLRIKLKPTAGGGESAKSAGPPADSKATHLFRRRRAHDPHVLKKAVELEEFSDRLQERVQKLALEVQDPKQGDCLMAAVRIMVAENSQPDMLRLSGDRPKDLAMLGSMHEKLVAVDEAVTRCRQ